MGKINYKINASAKRLQYKKSVLNRGGRRL